MAEGIKISDMERVTTLKEGCCFPVISDGTNKRITQKDLYSLMTSDLQEQITNNDDDIASLQKQVTDNKNDLQNQVTDNKNDLQNQVTDITNLQNQVNGLQSQITNISKPNNIEIFRYAINESTTNWIVAASGNKYKVIDLPTTITVINSCLSNDGVADVTDIVLNNEKKPRVTIKVDSDVTSCKGYFEYMI